MNKIKNIEIEGRHDKPILADIYYKKNASPKNIVIFCHGYKGVLGIWLLNRWPMRVFFL